MRKYLVLLGMGFVAVALTPYSIASQEVMGASYAASNPGDAGNAQQKRLEMAQSNSSTTDDQALSLFEQDIKVLSEHTDLIVLSDSDGSAQVAVVPQYQGRVMTSTTDGKASFGWINHDLISSGKSVPHINAYGGEDRFWLGPEGGQFGIYFKPGDPFTWEAWQVPAVIDTEPFKLVSQSTDRAVFRREARLTNYSAQSFKVSIQREVRLLDAEACGKALGLAIPKTAQVVGFETDNTIRNIGDDAWSKETGTLSIWILGMYTRSEETTAVMPYVKGEESDLGPIVNSAYFGEVPDDRLRTGSEAVFFRADSPFRSKIGLSPQRAKPILGSYDGENNVLTLVQYTKPEGATDYVNSMWALQEKPFGGDVVNSYNDGPSTPGGSVLGPFYELESSSPAALLDPGESINHIHRTIHIQADEAVLDALTRSTLNVGLEEIAGAFD